MQKEEFWVRHDGTKIAVEDMSEYHAKNALRKMIRESKTIKQTVSMILESTKRAVTNTLKTINK